MVTFLEIMGFLVMVNALVITIFLGILTEIVLAKVTILGVVSNFWMVTVMMV